MLCYSLFLKHELQLVSSNHHHSSVTQAQKFHGSETCHTALAIWVTHTHSSFLSIASRTCAAIRDY
jgi:hypothetical protein